MQSLLGRWLLTLAFLLTVNLGSGVLAVELGYPSLWGNTTGIFFEYGIPFLYNWALAHLLSMIPLAMVIFTVPTWPQRRLVQFRWAMVAALVVLFFVEVRLPYGRLNHIPFALFLIVDCLTALMIALIFRPPWKWIIGTIILLFAAAQILTYFNNSDSRERNRSPDPEVTSPDPEPVSNSFFERQSEYQRSDFLEIFVTVRETTGPDIGPKPDEICEQAKAVATKQLNDIRIQVQFMVHPHFEAQRKYIYPAGSASLEPDNRWQCDFSYPVPGP